MTISKFLFADEFIFQALIFGNAGNLGNQPLLNPLNFQKLRQEFIRLIVVIISYFHDIVY
jgi:hypothetical protein